MPIFIVTIRSINTLKKTKRRYRSASLSVDRVANFLFRLISHLKCGIDQRIFYLTFFLYKSRKLKNITYRDNMETFNTCRYYCRQSHSINIQRNSDWCHYINMSAFSIWVIKQIKLLFLSNVSSFFSFSLQMKDR